MTATRVLVGFVAAATLSGCCGRARTTCCPTPTPLPCPTVVYPTPAAPAPGPNVAVAKVGEVERPSVLLETSVFRFVPGGADRAIAGDAPSGGSRRLRAAEATALAESWAKESPAQLLNAPSVMQYDGEPATITIVEHEAPNAMPTGVGELVATPTTTGLVIASHSRASGDGVALDVDAAWRARSGEVAHRLRTTETIGADEAALVWSPKATPDTGRVVLLVRAQRIFPKAPAAR